MNLGMMKRRFNIGEKGIDYSKMYLTFEAITSGTFACTKAMNYSLDGGKTWIALEANTNTPTVNAGDTICWKQTITGTATSPGTFSSTGDFNVCGNVMSLYFADNFIGKTSRISAGSLFSSCKHLISSEKLILPSLNAPTYTNMFYNCINMVRTVAILPSPTVGSYNNAFYGCLKLENAPILPALTVPNYGYNQMFFNDNKINYIKAMVTTFGGTYSLNNWVRGVAAQGTFVKNREATWDVVGNNGVPSGWTIEYADE